MRYKRYELKKDLPTFKAGDIFILKDDGCLYWSDRYQEDADRGCSCYAHWKPEVMAYHKNTLERFPNILEEWFEEIEEPEDKIIGFAWHNDEVVIKMSSIEAASRMTKKLKAWKKMEDKGFRFDGYDVAHKSNGNLAGQIFYDAGNYSIEDIENEMDLLFGGGE